MVGKVDEAGGQMITTEAGIACFGQLAPQQAGQAERHPALVYLAGLAAGSRRTMAQALETVAAVVTGGDWQELEGRRVLLPGRCSMRTMPWHLLRYQHTAALRSKLAEVFKPATANKMLSAVRGVLRECWRLGLVDAESYQRATDLPSVRGSNVAAGRALTHGELLCPFRQRHCGLGAI
jgi:hypothetical protein